MGLIAMSSDYKQDAPFAIQIELSKGCNLQCSFCGINGFQTKPNSNYDFMTWHTAQLIAEEISFAGWNSRIEFAMHGEPTMNPDWFQIIAAFRELLPKHQLMLTSNGGGIVMSKDIQGTIENYFDSGGTILALDEYQGINLIPKIKSQLDEFELEDKGITVYNYPVDKKGNPHQRTKHKFITFIAPIDVSNKGTHSSLNNHCGSGDKLDMSTSNKRCAKPFREMSFNWDGSVNLCCNDFIGEYHCGNIHDDNVTIEDIWNNEYFESARTFLMVADRNALRPCRGCTAKSHRVGLLPDKFGKVDLPEPNENDAKIVLKALTGGPDRTPTKRARDNIIPSLTLEESEEWGI